MKNSVDDLFDGNVWYDKDFNVLRKKWYKKLKGSGFKDIEPLDNNGRPFPLLYDERISTKSAHDFSNDSNYYRAASIFLWNHPFEAKIDVLIWEKHANGEGISDIARNIKMERYRVRWIIDKYRNRLLREVYGEVFSKKETNDSDRHVRSRQDSRNRPHARGRLRTSRKKNPKGNGS